MLLFDLVAAPPQEILYMTVNAHPAVRPRMTSIESIAIVSSLTIAVGAVVFMGLNPRSDSTKATGTIATRYVHGLTTGDLYCIGCGGGPFAQPITPADRAKRLPLAISFETPGGSRLQDTLYRCSRTCVASDETTFSNWLEAQPLIRTPNEPKFLLGVERPKGGKPGEKYRPGSDEEILAIILETARIEKSQTASLP